MKACEDAHPCPVCQAAMDRIVVTVRTKAAPDSGWEYENGGRGRECTQFCNRKYKPRDPRNRRYFRSQRDLIETAKREGYSVERHR